MRPLASRAPLRPTLSHFVGASQGPRPLLTVPEVLQGGVPPGGVVHAGRTHGPVWEPLVRTMARTTAGLGRPALAGAPRSQGELHRIVSGLIVFRREDSGSDPLHLGRLLDLV